MGIIGHVVGAQSFLKDDGMRIAFEKFTQRSFEFAVGTEDIDAAEIDLGQVEEVVDIPVHTFGAAGEEIACAKTDVSKVTDHITADWMRRFIAAAGGVADESAGEGSGSFARQGGADIGVFAGAEFDALALFKSPEAQTGAGGDMDPEDIATAG